MHNKMIMASTTSTINLVVILVTCSVLFLIILFAAAASTCNNDIANNDSAPSSKCACDEALINRGGFPDGFIFGSATAAYQNEGAYNEKGKGPSMWDHFTHTYPDRIEDYTNGDVAVDSYHLYKEDVQLLKDMGVDAYRFSISWSRILPGGTINKGVNQHGIDYYNNLINELLTNGIEPWVVILHLDSPQALEDAYGGFLSSQIVEDFRDFADLVFSEFGDRVKHWITINEPWGLSYLGYTLGVFAPGRCSTFMRDDCLGGDSAIEPYNTTHNQILAHAVVVKLYRQKYQILQHGRIGIIVNSFWFVPYDETIENLNAKHRALDFMLGWIMDPITFGKYPESMRTRVGSRLPEFSKEEAEMVKGSFDFLGVNYYSAKYAVNIGDQPTHVSLFTDSGAMSLGVKNGIPIGKKGSIRSRYNSYPMGLREILRHIKEKYNNPVIYITENGFDEDRNESIPISEAIKDYGRKEYFYEHLCCLREAIVKDGVNVKGYFAWSLTDNFEWASGYLISFGLHYVDFKDKYMKRYPKYSAKWFKSLLERKIVQKPKSTRSIFYQGQDEDNKDIPMSVAIKDYKRKQYFLDHLCCLREAIEQDGVNVKGYMAWSLTDNFEWASGFLVRFRLHYVDYTDKSFRRYPKSSAKWFKRILKREVLNPQSTRQVSEQ